KPQRELLILSSKLKRKKCESKESLSINNQTQII
ncbi:MAG: hypothetical protein ACI9RU_000954, partial [Litorivivens sp.]